MATYEEEYEYEEAEEYPTEDSPVPIKSTELEYYICHSEVVFPVMDEFVSRISHMLQLPVDVVNLCLIDFQWKEESMLSKIYEEGKIDFYMQSLPMSISQRDLLKRDFVCGICGDDSPDSILCGMNCNHAFCRDCYRMHMDVKIQDGNESLFMCCPMRHCKTRISPQMVEGYCTSQMWNQYRNIMLRHFISSKKNFKYCRNEKCNSLILRDLHEITSFERKKEDQCLHIMNEIGIECRSCCMRMCFSCGDEDHYPIPCDLLQRWKELDRQEGQSMNWILTNTKKCPKCSFPIEKNQGCRHMHCRQCAHHFCWDCMHQWDTVCGYDKACKGNLMEGYEREGEMKVRKAKDDLQYYMRYFKGYMSQKDSVKHLEKLISKIMEKQTQFSKKNGLMHETVDYLVPTVSMIIQSRNIIKYCYVMNYFMEDRKEFLEFIQQELILRTEYLTHLVESDFETLPRVEIVNLSRILQSTLSGLHEQFAF